MDDAFGVVRVTDVPGVRTSLSHQYVGRTNARGDVVVPNLVSYYDNRLSIDASDVPLDPRTMRNGSGVLNYNLYHEAAFQTIWGDGTGGTQTYTALAASLVPATVTVYGQVPAGQNVAAGAYSDSVVATIIF